MKTVIYLDVLLLVNFIVGYFLLRSAGIACGVCPPFARNLLGAAAAALASLVLFLPPLPAPAQIVFGAAGALLAAGAAFPWQGARMYLRLTVWYFALNTGLAGLLMLFIGRGWLPGGQTNNLAVYAPISPRILFAGALAVYLCVRVLCLFLPKEQAETAVWEIQFPNAAAAVKVLRDTGFSAREPATARPVLLVSLPAVKDSLPPPAADFLAAWFAGENQPPPRGYRFCLVPLHTAGGPLLAPAFRLNVCCGGRLRSGIPVAFSPYVLGGGIQALAGPELFDE